MKIGGRLRESLGETVETVVDGSEEQVALAGEQAEHVRLGDADASRDAVHGRAMQPAGGELVDGGGDQRLTALRCGHAAAASGERLIGGVPIAPWRDGREQALPHDHIHGERGDPQGPIRAYSSHVISRPCGSLPKTLV